MKTDKIIPSALLLTLLSLFSPATAPAATYYVAWWGNSRNPGTLEHPFESVQRAFDTAATRGDTIVLHDGTYNRFGGNTRSKSITFVSLYGPTNCILDFAGGTSLGLNLVGGYPATTIGGFTLRNARGGCIYMTDGGTVTIDNCIFTANNDSPPVFIRDSTSYTYIYITNSVFTGNVGGGAIRVFGTGSLEVSRCQFFGNTEVGFAIEYTDGGAIWTDNLAFTKLSNCLFVTNRVAWGGGAVRSGSAAVDHCTFVDNYGGVADAISAFGELAIRNSILWDGGVVGKEWRTGFFRIVKGSNIRGGSPGTSNTNADPQFVRNPGTLGPSDPGDLHLQSTSPCRNAGVISYTVSDLDGTPRPMESGYDMGAYEFRDGPVGYWYVDAAHGNDADSNSGTPTSPFATVTKAVTRAANGNKIYVKQGNYGSDRPRITKALQLFNWGDTGLARIGQP